MSCHGPNLCWRKHNDEIENQPQVLKSAFRNVNMDNMTLLIWNRREVSRCVVRHINIRVARYHSCEAFGKSGNAVFAEWIYGSGNIIHVKPLKSQETCRSKQKWKWNCTIGMGVNESQEKIQLFHALFVWWSSRNYIKIFNSLSKKYELHCRGMSSVSQSCKRMEKENI